eukprot:gene13086-2360_t
MDSFSTSEVLEMSVTARLTPKKTFGGHDTVLSQTVGADGTNWISVSDLTDLRRSRLDDSSLSFADESGLDGALDGYGSPVSRQSRDTRRNHNTPPGTPPPPSASDTYITAMHDMVAGGMEVGWSAITSAVQGVGALALRIASGNGEDASGGDSGDGGEADVTSDVGDESGGSGGGISRRPSSKVSTSSRRGSSHSRRAHSTAENGGGRPKSADVEELQWDNEDEMSRESEKQKPLRRSAGGIRDLEMQVHIQNVEAILSNRTVNRESLTVEQLFNTSDDLLDNLRQYDYRKRGFYYITHPPEKWCCGKRVMAGLEADEWCTRPHALTDQVRAILEELELASSAEPSPGNHPTYRSTTSTAALPGLEPGAENASRCILRSPIDPVVSLNHVIAAWSYVAPGQSQYM